MSTALPVPTRAPRMLRLVRMSTAPGRVTLEYDGVEFTFGRTPKGVRCVARMNLYGSDSPRLPAWVFQELRKIAVGELRGGGNVS